jgi:hypothetical protein
MALPCCLQARCKPQIDTQPATCRNGHQDERQQNQHAVGSDPFSIGQAHVQLHREDRRQESAQTREKPEQQANGYNEFSRPDAGCQWHERCAANGR